jgi:DNA-binding LytR/AlgR family response regulator
MMKINLDIDGKYDDTEVIIRAPHLNNDIERMVAMMRMIDMQIAVRKDNETYLLDTDKILYIEAVDRKTFVYTNSENYESELKLYELEQELVERDFLRISKQSIVNLRKIKSLKTDVNRKIRITLQNGEQIVVSRMYSDELRRKLGLR